MHLFLIRHGETEHNVAGLLAGVTDSKLTNHGVLQTQKLARHLVHERAVRFTHIYSSDLQRAFMTAEEIRKASTALEDSPDTLEVIKIASLREQDFGSFELVPWSSKRGDDVIKSKVPHTSDPGFKAKETKDEMKARADSFIDDILVPLFALELDSQSCVAIASHGLLLGTLWRALLVRFSRRRVFIASEVGSAGAGRPLEFLPSWTNTGYLELDIQVISGQELSLVGRVEDEVNQLAISCVFQNAKMSVRAINAKPHLLNLKRTRGGVGSSPFDQRQRSIDGFFKKAKISKASHTVRSKSQEVIRIAQEACQLDDKKAN